MIRKKYQTPTTKVVELQHTGMLMASGEGSRASMQNYNVQDEQNW